MLGFGKIICVLALLCGGLLMGCEDGAHDDGWGMSHSPYFHLDDPNLTMEANTVESSPVLPLEPGLRPCVSSTVNDPGCRDQAQGID